MRLFKVLLALPPAAPYGPPASHPTVETRRVRVHRPKPKLVDAEAPGDLVRLAIARDGGGEDRWTETQLKMHGLDLEELESSPRLGRRAFLIGGLATGAALSAPVNYAALARSKRIPLAKHVKFPQGIASGFPYPRGTILWTRAEGLKKSARLKLEVAKDRHFKNTVLEKTVTARATATSPPGPGSTA